MPLVDQAVIQDFVDIGLHAQTTTEQGRALENLACYLFGLVPGIAITHRNEMNAFDTEEIDVALWNDGPHDGFHFLPYIILIECKNWSQKVSSQEVSWFDTKLRRRGLEFGILISVRGITGNAQELTAAHSIVASALTEKRRLVVVTVDELKLLTDTDALGLLIKKKLCDLAVRGSMV